MNKFFILSIVVALNLTSCQTKKDRLNEVVTNSIEKSDFNGRLYVEMNGDVLYHDAIVSPSLNLSLPGDSTKIYLASLTKLFTEVAVLKLSEQGEIDLGASISEYRKAFKPNFGDEITIENLLKMSSGLPREVSQDTIPHVMFNDQNLAGPFLDSIPDFKLSFTPGSNKEYSNLNYWVLGSIIEQVTNKNLHNAFEILIFDELGMSNSGVFNENSSILNGYFFFNNEWRSDSSNYEGRYASGGGYSTMRDLIILSKALKEGNYLNPESRKYLQNTGGKVEVFGSLPGYSNMFIQDIKNNYTIIALNNVGLRNLSLMTELKSSIEEELGIRPPEKSKRVVQLKPIEALNDSIAIEKSLRIWLTAVETSSADEIFEAIETASVKGSMVREDRTWNDLSQLNKTLPKFRALGYRWVYDNEPKGIEVWFGSDSEGKLAIRWLLSKKDSSLVENLFIMPDDMTWQGKSY